MDCLTILTATFNLYDRHQADTIRRCVESVRCISCPHEHIICDGGSTDGTVGLLRTIAKEDASVRIYSEPDCGIYDALNKGLARASGKYIYVLGADDYIDSPSEIANAFFRGLSKNVDIIVSPVHVGKKIHPKHKRNIFKIVYRMGYQHQGVMVKTEKMRKIGGYDLRYKITADHHSLMRLHLMEATLLPVWKPYATISMDGFSSQDPVLTFREDIDCVAEVYGLENQVARRFWCDGVAPWKLIVDIFRRGPFMRHAAWFLVMKRFFHKTHWRRISVYVVFGIPMFLWPRKKKQKGDF